MAEKFVRSGKPRNFAMQVVGRAGDVKDFGTPLVFDVSGRLVAVAVIDALPDL